MKKLLGIYYTYRSRYNDAECVAVVTLESHNFKTGKIAQVWFLNRNEAPHTLRKKNCEQATCGDCPLQGGNGCYVRTEQAPLQVWKSFHAGRYVNIYDLTREQADYVCEKTRETRIGAYGDPASMFPEDFGTLMCALNPRRHTGYTHGWREAPWLRQWCMASTTWKDNAEAIRAGWSTFCAVPGDTPHEDIHVPEAGLYVCPAIAKGIQCKGCFRCHGRYANSTRGPVTIAVPVHGARAGKVYA